MPGKIQPRVMVSLCSLCSQISGAVILALKHGVKMLQRRSERPLWEEVNEGLTVAVLQEFSWRQQHQQLPCAQGKWSFP